MKARKEQATPVAASRGTIGWIALGLVAAVFLVYGSSARNAFISLDDEPYIYGNPHVPGGLTWHNVRWAFTTFHESNWHPLTWLSHMLDAQLYGLAPAGHHLTNAALHAASSVLLFLFLRRATGRVGASALVGFLFALHPLHVESVAWAAERKDVLSGFFWMVTLVAYGAYVRRPGVARYAAVLASFALGLLAKPMLVTLPFVLLLLDVWPFGRWRAGGSPPGKLLLEKVPLFLLSAASSVVTLAAQSAGASVRDLGAVSAASRLANAAVSFVWYLVKTVWPSSLAVLYPHPALAFPERAASFLALGAAATVVLAGLTVVAVHARRDHPFLLSGWLWYLGTLVPVIGIVQVGVQGRADRYAYIPLIGIFVALVWEGSRIVERRPALRTGLVGGAVVAVAALGCTAAVQVTRWRDGVTLYRHALSVTERNYLVQYNLGRTLQKEGRREEAAVEQRAALALQPRSAVALYNYAAYLTDVGDVQGARTSYEEAVRIDPALLEARINLGAVLASLGDAQGANAQFEECLRLNPRFAAASYSLGILRFGQGDLDGAQAAFEGALGSQPDYAEAMNGLAAVLLRQGKFAEAARSAEDALRIRGDSIQAWFNLGLASIQLADLERAQVAFERCVALDPHNARAVEELRKLRGGS